MRVHCIIITHLGTFTISVTLFLLSFFLILSQETAVSESQSESEFAALLSALLLKITFYYGIIVMHKTDLPLNTLIIYKIIDADDIHDFLLNIFQRKNICFDYIFYFTIFSINGKRKYKPVAHALGIS